MKKFEYCAHYFESNKTWLQILDRLNEIGSEGWQIVAVAEQHNQDRSGFVYTLMRELP